MGRIIASGTFQAHRMGGVFVTEQAFEDPLPALVALLHGFWFGHIHGLFAAMYECFLHVCLLVRGGQTILGERSASHSGPQQAGNGLKFASTWWPTVLREENNKAKRVYKKVNPTTKLPSQMKSKASRGWSDDEKPWICPTQMTWKLTPLLVVKTLRFCVPEKCPDAVCFPRSNCRSVYRFDCRSIKK